jgi:hypothetical protein
MNDTQNKLPETLRTGQQLQSQREQDNSYRASARDSPGGAGYSKRTPVNPAALSWLRTVSAAELPLTDMIGVRLPSWSKSAFNRGTSTFGCSSFRRAVRSVSPFKRGYLHRHANQGRGWVRHGTNISILSSAVLLPAACSAPRVVAVYSLCKRTCAVNHSARHADWFD